MARDATHAVPTAALLTGGVLLLLADQVTKAVARHSMQTLCNGGAALSMPSPRMATVAVSAVVLVLLTVWLVRHRTHAVAERIGLALIIAGGASNLVDRVWQGCVTDFIAFFDFWHFNLADAAIAAGVALLFWYMIVVAPGARRDCD